MQGKKKKKLVRRERYKVIVIDPPWAFNDKLTMSDVKRGAEANYNTMTMSEIAGMSVHAWSLPDSMCALWVPSSLITEGLAMLKAWGFTHKQIVTWVKTSKSDAGLAFGMGRYFRGCTEHVLIGTRGKLAKDVLSKSERNVIMAPAMPHSKKPEDLQDALQRMLPGPYLEVFARRSRKGWRCVGYECPSTPEQDIRTWQPPRIKTNG